MALLSNNKNWPSIFLLHINITLILSTYYGCALNLRVQNVSKSSIQAIFVFGDSTVDPGNNNNIETLVKSDFSPYGVDFPRQIPTGRFCNGKLPTDIIASYMGIKENIPAYLDPNLSSEDLITGVSFASAGSGYDPLTAAKNGVIEMEKQLQHFDEYKIRVTKNGECSKTATMAGQMTQNTVPGDPNLTVQTDRNAAYCNSKRLYKLVEKLNQKQRSDVESIGFGGLLEIKLASFFQGMGIKDRGAEMIGVVGLPPVGCLPAVITMNRPFKPRHCVESLSSLAMDFNRLLQTRLTSIQLSQPTLTVLYADIYTPLLDQISHPLKYGFEEVDKGCCGSGMLESALVCNSLSDICSDRSKFLFWDSIHPTEQSYRLLVEALRPLIDYVMSKSA